MKRILFISILAALLCGCIPAGNGGQGSTTDSVCIDTADSFVQDEPEPEPEPPFTSPDLKWKQLQGHVKQLICFGEGGDATYNFDRQGNFISYHDSFGYPYEIKRNKKDKLWGGINGWMKLTFTMMQNTPIIMMVISIEKRRLVKPMKMCMCMF